jgi:hypothetical protein
VAPRDAYNLGHSMSFTRRYLQWLLIPPVFISIPPALLFLSQVVQLTAGSAVGLTLLLVVTYAIGCVTFTLGVRPQAQAVEDALAGKGDPSRAMSECLDRTKSLSLMLWGGGGLIFAIIAALLFMRSMLGVAYSSWPRSSPRSSPWFGATRWASTA